MKLGQEGKVGNSFAHSAQMIGMLFTQIVQLRLLSVSDPTHDFPMVDSGMNTLRKLFLTTSISLTLRM
jgi:hypothetical protein